MDAARWEQVQALFHAAADLPLEAREALLHERAGSDAELRAEVAALLVEDARGHALLDGDRASLARQVLAPSGALPTTRFGPYHLTRLLGEGGMGVVYLGEREDLGSVAAIKLLRDAWLSPARRDRFESEQRTLAQLNHPNIARLYDADALPDGTPWIAMEYVDGVPITAWCDARQATVPERLRLFRTVCEAVQHAHRHLVIHRDLKPSNILVTAEGQVKLLDFGIAKQLDSLDLPADQTQTGLRLLTPAYAAPEQIRGGRTGIYTDVYALGVTLYQLLTGRLPFDLADKTPEEAARIITEEVAERPSSAALRTHAAPARIATSAAWADLDVLCLTAMHRDAQRRYRTVEALLRDVDHFLAGEPLEARPDTVGYRVGKFIRRNRVPVLASAVALVTLATLVVFYTVRLTRARNEARAEAARTQRIQRFMTNLFQNGDESTAPGDSLRVVTVIDRGLEEAQSLAEDPALQSELDITLGVLYQQLGKYERADSLLRAALEIRRRVLGPEHPDVATAQVALGELRLKQARYEEAEENIRSGLRLARRTYPTGHPAIARATSALGQVLVERGAYDSAVPVVESALQLYAQDTASADYASALSDLANAHFYAGHYPLADSLYRRVLGSSRRLYGDRHPHVAEDLSNLGQIQQMLGTYTRAEEYYRQAFDIAKAWYGLNHPETASYLTMLGRSLLFQNKWDSAHTALSQALAIQEQLHGPDHPEVGNALNELGSLAWQRDQLDEAERSWTRVVDIYRAAYGEKHQFVAVALSNLSGVYQQRKQYGKAEALLREAIGIYSETLSPEHVNVGIGHIKLGRVLLRSGRYAEAVEETSHGYDILIKQTDPAVSFLKAARKDLVAAYDSLGQPEKAERYRRELADTLAPARK
ncbi:MAG TPA: serine/threonine-protein kinase [Gemmatimonadales bacterium]|nr:serine/threonine-protein kinase [Gemmatimonadales bacterium]